MVAWPLICFGISHTGFFRLYYTGKYSRAFYTTALQDLKKEQGSTVTHLWAYLISGIACAEKIGDRLEVEGKEEGRSRDLSHSIIGIRGIHI